MRVIVGGTFAYMHRGHRALLGKAFGIGDYVYIGLTTDSYVKRLKLHGNIPGYGARKRMVAGFAGRYGKDFEVMPLDDRFGPSTTGEFDAIVVSPETYGTAIEINKIRKAGGLKELRIIRIRYVLAEDSVPISTTRILKGEIDREGKVLRDKSNKTSGRK